MSDRALALLLLVIAGVAMVSSTDRPSPLITTIMIKLAIMFFGAGLLIVVFHWVFSRWPRGFEGFALLVGFIIIGFGLLLPEANKARVRQEAYWNEWTAKAIAYDKWSAKRPKDAQVKCDPNDWDVSNMTCRYVNLDKSVTGCFKNGAERADEVCKKP